MYQQKCSKNPPFSRKVEKSKISGRHTAPYQAQPCPVMTLPINVKLSDHCGHCAHRFAHPWTMHSATECNVPEPMSVKPYREPVVRSYSTYFFTSISSMWTAHSLYADELWLSFWSAMVSNDCWFSPGLASYLASQLRIVLGHGSKLKRRLTYW